MLGKNKRTVIFGLLYQCQVLPNQIFFFMQYQHRYCIYTVRRTFNKMVSIFLILLLCTTTQAMASPKASLPNITSSIFNVSQLNFQHYEDQLLLYTLTGLVNRKYPNLFLDTGSADMDFPQSDRHWIQHLTDNRNVTFTTIAPTLCALVTHFQQQMQYS